MLALRGILGYKLCSIFLILTVDMFIDFLKEKKGERERGREREREKKQCEREISTG